MEWIRHDINLDIVGKRHFFVIFSTVLNIAAILLILFKGFNYGIDFAGGLDLRVEFNKSVHINEVRSVIDSLNIKGAQVSEFMITGKYIFSIKTKGEHQLLASQMNLAHEAGTAKVLPDVSHKIISELQKRFGEDSVSIISTDMVGARVGADLRKKGIWAISLAMLAMMIYLGLRYNFRYSPGAIVAVIHDVLLTAGLFALTGKEVTLTVVAAFLTIAGYSMNDNIVIFDRIREGHTKYRRLSLLEICNKSINETLSRTILTSFATALSVVGLYFYGGDIIKDFAFAMLFGIVVGTYSSIYIASPIYILLEEWTLRRRKRARR